MTHPDDGAFAKPSAIDPNGNHWHESYGLTKREYFAAIAMQGIASQYGGIRLDCDFVAQHAVNQADALIAALNKPVQP